MALNVAEPSGPDAGAAGGPGAVEPSLRGALPYFLAVAIFPLVINAAIHGGWWLALPLAFYWLASLFDARLGDDERNMDPERTPEGRLLWYKLAVWMWAVLWPVTFVFSLWQMLVAGHLAAWEIALMAVVLAMVAQSVFIAGHEMIHRLPVWERRFGEFLLSSVSYPHYTTEHIYIHHALVGTPYDVGSAPRGRASGTTSRGRWRATSPGPGGCSAAGWRGATCRCGTTAIRSGATRWRSPSGTA